jgi:hypothetical protein
MNLRALSGGPVYISDPPEVTNMDVLWPLMLRSGRLLRCDNVGVPTEDCLLVDAAATRVPLKVQNRAGDAGLVGLFHVSQDGEPVSGCFRPSDVDALAGDKFAVWAHGSRQGRCLARDEAWQVDLQPATSQVFVVAPIRDGFAPIGVIDKIVSPKTISFWRQRPDEVRLLLIERGMFVAYCQTKPRQVRIEGRPAPFEHHEGWLQLQVPEASQSGSLDVTILL